MYLRRASQHLPILVVTAFTGLLGGKMLSTTVGTSQGSTGVLQGMDIASLATAREVLEKRNTRNFLVIRRSETVYEWYSSDAGPDKRHYTASLAKALVGGSSLMLALEEGRMGVDDFASSYIPAWRDDPVKSKITIRHLATHSSGIENAEQDDIPHMELPGWKGAFWRREPDPFSIAIDQAPVVFVPGTKYAYSNPGMAALAYAVTRSLQGGEFEDIRSLLKNRLMDPLGLEEKDWSIGYGQPYPVDGMQLYANWGGGSFTARAVARIGRLMMQRGHWKGRQLVDPEWIDTVLSYAGTPLPPRSKTNPQPGSGLSWWLNFDGIWPGIPTDAFAGAGAGQQVLLVVPSLQLVVVRNGGVLTDASEPEEFWGAIVKYIFDPVIRSVVDRPIDSHPGANGPYPPSPIIKNIQFGPKQTIIRKGHGSDNWPLTWAEDGFLYTAYGDGWGFEPKVEAKLSLGFAQIDGYPPGFLAHNVRSATGEQSGDGSSGKKASGLLAIGTRLFMWARNAGNAQLAWSDDRARSWKWSEWKLTTSFGHPTFLNFGRGYIGSRDNYVYIYSHDSNSAYDPSDRMVLARVSKEQLPDRTAYEFFSGIKYSQVHWSKEIERRSAVFAHPGRCYRSSVSYNSGLGRYLWVQIHPGESPRFYGGFGIYDAPQPWGPWTTVFFTEHWDVGPGENAHFPTKWISENGRELYLVFSGDDAFSVRKVDLVLAD